jgi:hypothetical protein
MGRQRQQVQPEGLNIYRNSSGGLDGVGMKEDAVPLSDPGDLFNRLKGAHFIIRVHEGNQDRIRPDGPAHVTGVNPSTRIDREIGDVKPLPLKVLTGMKDGMVFDGRGDDMSSPASVLPGGAFDRQIISFGPAPREDDLPGAGVDKGCYLLPPRSFRLLAEV